MTPIHSLRTLRRSIVALTLLCGAAKAQVPDSLPSFDRPNGALMRSAALTYSLSLAKPGGQIVPLGTRLVTVTDAPLAGSPAWLIADARRGTAVETTDSVWLARADLAPARWTSTMGRAQLGASFTRDSAFGAVDTYQGRASFAVGVAANTLLSAGMVERVIELLPVHVGYRVTATLLLVEGSSPRAVPAEIAVDRDVRIDAGGRAVDCWLVTLRAGAIEERLWVAKDGTRVIRTEQAVADGLLVSVLVQ